MPITRTIKPWLAVEALPIVALVGGMVSFASWFTLRSARGPSIQWSNRNPEPWNTIRPDQGTKMVQVHHKFDKTSVLLCLFFLC
ncbi:hypothetical protein FB45DRAFT_902996 [Roridomyces roridus]|uniref:NADH dehydrogenase [ubiquinone] 1 alpha subcomplex subunit 4 n=1 Tax=Roridomyces roridus TaxID=1738132 RepID=A0AAD7FUQ2_9AGAR|nr:hypothetical protein FB45DRAFT_902996 [Roridomyces roridus]